MAHEKHWTSHIADAQRCIEMAEQHKGHLIWETFWMRLHGEKLRDAHNVRRRQEPRK